MNFFSAIFNGMREIWAHKFRSFLSMIGIILGVAALVAMVGVVQGMISNFRVFFEEQGGIERIDIQDDEIPEEQLAIAYLSKGRTIRDAWSIRAAVPLADYVSPIVSLGWQRLIWRNRRTGMRVYGATPDVLEVERLAVAEGRFISDLDLDMASPVVVIGSIVKDRLFRSRPDIIGEAIRIRGQTYTVIGVLKHYEFDQGGRNALRWKNFRTYIPITTAMKRFTGTDKIHGLSIKISDISVLPDIVPQLENTLLQTHNGIRDFQIQTREEQLLEFQKLERSFLLSLGGVAAISLLVGGIGIMNVMLAVINERIREIGVRKAVGARGSDVFIQFLAEAIVISVVGGILGIIASVGFIEVLKSLLPDEQMNILISPKAMIAGFAFSVIIGVVAGIYPALRAARLNVIEALRFE